MSTLKTSNHLIMRRMKTSFSKTKDQSNKNKKIKEKTAQTNEQGLNFNLSMDVKNFMNKQKLNNQKNKSSNTINFQDQFGLNKRRHSLFFPYSKKYYEGVSIGSVKFAYSGTPNSTQKNLNNYNSQKTIKQRRKKLSLSGDKKMSGIILGRSGMQTPQNRQSQNLKRLMEEKMTRAAKESKKAEMEKQVILTKYEKIKQLLKSQKYQQASHYLKQIIPHIQQKSKRKELYFMLIASLFKSSAQASHFQEIQNYIVQCLNQFPNFYDIYLYWAKSKLLTNQKQEAIQIYQKAINIQPHSSESYIKLADIYFQDNQNSLAYNSLQKAFYNCINSNSIPFIIIQNYKSFELDIQNNLASYIQRISKNSGSKSTQYLYAMGFVQKQKNNLNEALIYFLQSLKYNSNKLAATKSLQNLIKIHIQKSDFYSAIYDLKRSQHLNLDFKRLQKYQSFLEGINFVMKKKNQQGIKILSKIVDEAKKNQLKNQINTFVKIKKIKEKDNNNFQRNSQFFILAVKYLAYAHFKLGNHKQTLFYYKKLLKNRQQFDKVTQYNTLLSEGIILADVDNNFQRSFQKFEKAKSVLNKVEPWIYQAMVSIQKQLFKHKNKNLFLHEGKIEKQLSQSVLEAMKIMNQGYLINSSSSNLLYHRTILHLYFGQLKDAMEDVNLCIQKAEQNLPKYFHLRGICYACTKNIKKAINQFSIAISLNKLFSQSFLQRAKCYFLLGQTQMGFQDLKIYIDQCPKDYTVHKWIGDLLFQGTSYNDCIKAYNQMGDKITLQALCMRLKAQLKFTSIKRIQQTMKQIQSHKDFDQQFFKLDLAAYNLLSILIFTKNGSQIFTQKQKYFKAIESKIKILNQYLESDIQRSKIFSLVDCLNLIGISSFYIEQYNQAYESFLLVLQFFKSTKQQEFMEKDSFRDESTYRKSQVKYKEKLNAQNQQENFDLRQQDIYYNILICCFALKNLEAIKKIIDQQMISLISQATQKKVIKNIMEFLNVKTPKIQQKITLSTSSNEFSTKNNKSKLKKQEFSFFLEPRLDNPLNHALKKLQFSIHIQKQSFNIKTSLVWAPYHSYNQNLYFTTMAKKFLLQLHTGYIDNMPEGPWIRRNNYGVLFTDNILEEGNQSVFISTHRVDEQRKKSQKQKAYEQVYQFEEQKSEKGVVKKNNLLAQIEQKDIKQRKKDFLKQMKLDLQMQNKLNKIIKKP